MYPLLLNKKKFKQTFFGLCFILLILFIWSIYYLPTLHQYFSINFTSWTYKINGLYSPLLGLLENLLCASKHYKKKKTDWAQQRACLSMLILSTLRNNVLNKSNTHIRSTTQLHSCVCCVHLLKLMMYFSVVSAARTLLSLREPCASARAH